MSVIIRHFVYDVKLVVTSV